MKKKLDEKEIKKVTGGVNDPVENNETSKPLKPAVPSTRDIHVPPKSVVVKPRAGHEIADPEDKQVEAAINTHRYK